MSDRLDVRMGNKVGESFRVRSVGSTVEKTSDVHGNIVDGIVSSNWTSVLVLTGRAIRDKKNYRFFKLVPSSEEDSLEHGEFFLRGCFRVAVTINNAHQAREAWTQSRDGVVVDVGVIHILHRGLPLCLFCDKPTPAEWPPGHQWVSMSDQNIAEHVDCRACKEQYEKILLLRRK